MTWIVAQAILMTAIAFVAIPAWSNAAHSPILMIQMALVAKIFSAMEISTAQRILIKNAKVV
jgi:hypothetical protein